jgi:hypothetical protein
MEERAMGEPVRMLPGVVERVETGPVRFGDDWPGVFIRGDNAHYFGFILAGLLNNPEVKMDTTERWNVEAMVELLESCDVRSTPDSNPSHD